MSTTTATTGPSALSALLSLSNAAAASPPIPLSTSLSSDTPSTQLQSKSTPIPITSPTMSKKDVMTQGGNSKQGALKHRRLSSTGQARRRMSDARDAAASVGLRPGVHSTASAFASLTLSSSASSPPPPPPHNIHHGHSHSLSDVKNMTSTTTSIPIAVPTTPSSRRALAKSVPTSSLISSPPDGNSTNTNTDARDDIEVDVEDDEGDGEIDGGDDNDNDDDEKFRGGGASIASKTSTSLPATANTTKSAKPGKKRGNIYRCESCSKVYRHPSCLVKHRWEHSPHWREASKLMLSKHQQVQLLEAAAILSHLQPGSSLPEDRSLWPSYLSGGLLPPPSTTNIPINSSTSRNKIANSNGKDAKVSSPVLSANGVVGGDAVAAVSSSVPANSTFGMVTRARSGSTSQTLNSAAAASGTGPRMHDYKLPTRQSGITQIRPGIIGMANPASASPPPASSTTTTPHGIVAVGAKPSAVPITQGYSSYTYGNSYRDTSGVSVSVSSVSGSVSVGGASLGESYGVSRRLEDDDEDYENGHHSYSYGDSSERVSDERGRRYDQDNDLGAGGWSLPRSDIRSGSRSGSGSGSRSGSRSDEEESDVDIDVDVTNKHINGGGYHHTNGHGAGHGYGYRSGLTGGYGGNHAYGNGYGNAHANGGWKREEDDAFAYGLDERDEMEYEYGKEREREREEQERRKGLRAHEEEWVDGMDVDF